MKNKIFVVVVSLAVLVLNSCNSNPVDSPPQPGRRDYVWTVDTLNMPMNFIGSVWGSSPSDVWAVGAGGDDNDRLQHYNGKKWAPYTKEPIYCAGNTLFGFSQDNVWMGGDDGAIWHFDGNKWSPNFTYKVPGARIVDVVDIWGNLPNDLYASGHIIYGMWSVTDQSQGSLKSFILHYNGLEWTEIVEGKNNRQFLSIMGEQKNIYVFSFSPSSVSSDEDTISFYKLNGNNIDEIYSNTRDKIVWGNIHEINGDVYFLIGQDVYRYFFGKLMKQFSFSNPNFWYYIFGRNENDIFVSMRDGLAHYNGADIQYLIKYPNLSYKIIGGDPVVFEKEIFCGFFSNGRNMILHGRLKE